MTGKKCGECRFYRIGWCDRLECPVRDYDDSCHVFKERWIQNKLQL